MPAYIISKKGAADFGKIPVDTELSAESENPVQNKTLNQKFEEVTAKFEELNEKIDSTFEGVGTDNESRFEELSQRIEEVNNKFEDFGDISQMKFGDNWYVMPGGMKQIVVKDLAYSKFTKGKYATDVGEEDTPSITQWTYKFPEGFTFSDENYMVFFGSKDNEPFSGGVMNIISKTTSEYSFTFEGDPLNAYAGTVSFFLMGF